MEEARRDEGIDPEPRGGVTVRKEASPGPGERRDVIPERRTVPVAKKESMRTVPGDFPVNQERSMQRWLRKL